MANNGTTDASPEEDRTATEIIPSIELPTVELSTDDPCTLDEQGVSAHPLRLRWKLSFTCCQMSPVYGEPVSTMTAGKTETAFLLTSRLLSVSASYITTVPDVTCVSFL